MVLIGVWLLSTNTMGIKTTDFILLVANSGNRMQMLSLEGGKTWLTATLKKRSKVESIPNCLFAKSKNQRSTEAHNIMAMSVLEFISKISGRSDLERGTSALKNRWPGHPSIPPRVFGPSQYLMTPPVQLTKPSTLKLKLTSKPLPAN